jgi:hypothetical protein
MPRLTRLARRKETTMQVKLIAQISGTRNGEDWPAPGELVALPDDEAASLIQNGFAIDPDASDEETSTAPDGDVETATPPAKKSAAKKTAANPA